MSKEGEWQHAKELWEAGKKSRRDARLCRATAEVSSTIATALKVLGDFEAPRPKSAGGNGFKTIVNHTGISGCGEGEDGQFWNLRGGSPLLNSGNQEKGGSGGSRAEGWGLRSQCGSPFFGGGASDSDLETFLRTFAVPTEAMLAAAWQLCSLVGGERKLLCLDSRCDRSFGVVIFFF
jgi:hypothetical protein